MATEYLVLNVAVDNTNMGNIDEVTQLLNQMSGEGWDLVAAVNVFEDMDRLYLERRNEDEA